MFGLFRKKEIAEEKEITLDEALELYKGMEGRSSATLLEAGAGNVSANMKNLGELSDFVRKFREKNIENEYARGSKMVKDTFCDRMLGLVQTIREPHSSVEGYRDFSARISKFISDFISTTPRQAMHLDFFYKDDLRTVAKMMKKIEDENNALISLMKDSIDKVKDMESLFVDIKSCRLEIEKNNSLGTVELEEAIRENVEEIGSIDLSELVRKEDEIESLVRRKKEIAGIIDSELSQLSRLIKKYHYISGKKEEIIEMYISRPYEAFRQDEEMKIKEIISDCIFLYEQGKIDIESKRIDKAMEVLQSLGELLQLLEEVKSIEARVQEASAYIEGSLTPLSIKKRDLMMQADMLRLRIEEMKKMIVNARERNEQLSAQIDSDKEKIATLLSDKNTTIKIK